MPEHDHRFSSWAKDGRFTANSSGNYVPYTDWPNTTNKTGGGQPHNNIPPTLSVLYWRCVA